MRSTRTRVTKLCYNKLMVKSKKKKSTQFPKKLFLIIIPLLLILGIFLLIKNSSSADYIVETNAFFAPFEFYEDQKIKGVDIDIINAVAEKLGKTIKISDVEFDIIIDNVAAGQIADAGAAGLTITPSCSEKVDFTIPYYTSVQYLIFATDNPPVVTDNHITWNALAGKTLGSQTGGTGYLFASDEAENGVLEGTGTVVKGFDSHQLAADAISSHIIDYAIADELPAQFIISKNPNLSALPLYYAGATSAEDYPVEESYAIAVNKNRPELLAAFNSVLTEMLEKDTSGLSTIDRLVLKYMGLQSE